MKTMVRQAGLWLPMLALLLACGSDPPPPPPLPAPEPPTVVKLTIESAADLNADAGEAGVPLLLRVYQLREASSFNAADFFSLFDKDQATLGADMARKQELLIKPNDRQSLTLELAPDIKVLGFFAAYRRLDSAQWRATLPVAAHKTGAALIKLRANEVLVEPVAADKAVK